MDKTKFKNMFNQLLRSYGSENGIRDKALSTLIGFKYKRFQRLRYNAYTELPDLKELKTIEEFFKVDLKEYYPTQCPKIQEYIMKRLDNGIKRTDMSKLLGYPIQYHYLVTLETRTFEQLCKNQRIIYFDFMNLLIN